jgi:glycogen debranching enzyme
VWPHDNSIILAGMKRYGRTDGVTRIAAGLLRAAEGFELARLPELFAGYSTDETDQPVPYPVSCSPQAWAAGTPISVLQTLLGLEPDALDGTVRIHPYLPDGIDALRIASIRIGDGSLSLQVKRETNGLTSVAVEQNTTGLAVVLHSM